MLTKKIALILTPILVFLSLNIILSNSISERLVYPTRYKYDMFPEDNEIFDYAVVGHSHARDAFEFDLTEIYGINLALSAQTIEWSDKMLRKYDNHFNEETVIIIEVSYNSFCTDIQEPRIRYVPLGFSNDEIGLDYEDYLIDKFFPLIGMNGAWDYLLNDRTHFADNQLEFPTEELLIANAISYYESNFNGSECNPVNIERNYEDLVNLVEYQISKNRRLIIFSAPIYGEVANRLTEENEKMKISQDLIENISLNYDIEYFKFYDLEIVNNDYKNFRNSNHLNSAGSKTFMEYFFELVK